MASFNLSRPLVITATAIALLSLTACQAPAKKTSQLTATATNPSTQSAVKQQPLGAGLYEMAYLPANQALYVASAQEFKGANGGVIYRVNPQSLQVTSVTHTDLKNFGVAFENNSQIFYITNTVDGTISKIDGDSGKVLQRLALSKNHNGGRPVSVREAVLKGDELYVGAVTDPGFIAVVDTQSMRVKQRITHAGKAVTGLLYSQATGKIYAANMSGEILVINPTSHKIEQRWKPEDGKEYRFLNLAEDPASGRLFVTDNNQAKATLVFDMHSGKVIKQIPGDSLAVKFNAKRNEIYLSQRGSKRVLQIDASDYKVKNSWSFTQAPNSLLLSPDGNTLFVTVKQLTKKGEAPAAPDNLVKISLN